MERISKAEQIERKAPQGELRRDAGAAGGSKGRVRVAERRLQEPVDGMEMSGQYNGIYRFLDGIPVLGRPFLMLFENIEKSVCEYGLLKGLLHGCLIGMVIAGAWFAFSEAVAVGHTLLKAWLHVHVEAPAIERVRTAHVNETARLVANGIVHRGLAVAAARDVTFYPVEMVSPWIIDDTLDVTYEYIMEHDPMVFERKSTELDRRIKLRPFFRRSSERLSSLPLASEAAHSNVATIVEPNTGAEYAMAGLDEDLILIPMAAYKAAVLPMSEELLPTGNVGAEQRRGSVTEKNAPSAPTADVLDLVHAVTISDEVPFVGIDCSEANTPSPSDLSGMLAFAAQMTRWFHHNGPTQPDKLPAGTYYRPLMKNVGDANSILVVGGQTSPDQYLVVTARIKGLRSRDGRDYCGLIPREEYDLHVSQFTPEH